MALPDITDLPYANQSHFDKLLEMFDGNDIVRVFTSLLLEERVLLIMDNPEELLPVSYALQSLIYPFELTIFIPYLANDNDDIDVSALNHVSQPYSYLIGIASKDKHVALDILRHDIEYDERTSPIIVDLSKENKKSRILTFERVPGLVLNKGLATPLTDTYKKDASLPAEDSDKLVKAIQKAKDNKHRVKFNRHLRDNSYIDCHESKANRVKHKINTLPRPSQLYRNSRRTISEVRKAFFSTIATLFLHYEESI